MTFLTWVLILLWLPACVTALIFLIRPSKRWPLFGTRMRSFLMLLALSFGTPVLIALIAPASMRADPNKVAATPPVASNAPALNTPASNAPPSNAPAVASGDAQGALDHPEYYLELSDVKLAKGADGKVLLSGTITSAAEVALKNPTVACYLSKGDQDAGMITGVAKETIRVGKSIRIAALDLGAAKGAWSHQVCKITGAEAAKVG